MKFASCIENQWILLHWMESSSFYREKKRNIILFLYDVENPINTYKLRVFLNNILVYFSDLSSMKWTLLLFSKAISRRKDVLKTVFRMVLLKLVKDLKYCLTFSRAEKRKVNCSSRLIKWCKSISITDTSAMYLFLEWDRIFEIQFVILSFTKNDQLSYGVCSET